MCTYQSCCSRDMYWTVNWTWLCIQTYLHSDYSTFDYVGYTVTVCFYIYIIFFQMSLNHFGWLPHSAVGCLSHVLILCSLSCCWLVTLWSLMLAGCRFLLRASWDLDKVPHNLVMLETWIWQHSHIMQRPKDKNTIM